MELNELHVGHGHASAPSHGHAVAGGHAGVGRVKIHTPTAAGGEDYAVAAKGLYLARCFVEHIKAQAAILGDEAQLRRRDEVDGKVIFQHFDVRCGADGGQQFVRQFLARGVSGMQHPPLRVTAFTGEVKLQVAIGGLALIEVNAPVDDLGDAVRTFRDDGPHGPFFAKASTGDEGIAHMLLDAVALALHAGDAALRPRGI